MQREELRDLATLLYRGFVSLCIEVLSRDCDEQTMISEIKRMTQYHIAGLATLVSDKNETNRKESTQNEN